MMPPEAEAWFTRCTCGVIQKRGRVSVMLLAQAAFTATSSAVCKSSSLLCAARACTNLGLSFVSVASSTLAGQVVLAISGAGASLHAGNVCSIMEVFLNSDKSRPLAPESWFCTKERTSGLVDQAGMLYCTFKWNEKS